MKIIVAQAMYSKPQALNGNDAKKAWEDGKDFEIISMGENFGRYCSCRDVKIMQDHGITEVSIRLRTGPLLAVITL